MEFEQVYDLYFRDVYRYILKLSGLRKEKHTTPLEELPESVGSADTPEELIGAREEARQIQAILHDLPEPYREVFMWRVYAELSYKQIGELFAKSDNWACVTYHRARNMIKNSWRNSNNEKGIAVFVRDLLPL